MATLTRDAILNRALDMVAAPALNFNDRPNATIVSTAVSIMWLQDALNLFYDEFPLMQLVKLASVTLAAGASTFTPPSDFIYDVRDGLFLPSSTPNGPLRLQRTTYQQLLARVIFTDTTSAGQGVPKRYAIMSPTVIQYWPTADVAYAAKLAYYARPASLAATDIPVTFPSDLPLVEYVRLRGLEWIRAIDNGSALKYVLSQIADLRKSGLGFEPEDSTIGFDTDQFIPGGSASSVMSGWMGPFSTKP
jgi:hypothetical protein